MSAILGSRWILRNGLRYFSSSSLQFQASSSSSSATIGFQNTILSLKDKASNLQVADSQSALTILTQCKQLQDELTVRGGSENELQQDIGKITTSVLHKTKIDQEFLKKYWLSQPNFTELIISIDSFYNQHRAQKKAVIPKDTVLIPLRRLLFDGKIDEAFKLVDSTVASSKYLEYKGNERINKILKFFAAIFGTMGGVELLVRNLGVVGGTGLGGIYLAVLAYIGNMSFLASVAFSKRVKDKKLSFDNGTFQKYWYQHSDELQMLSSIVEADLMINDHSTGNQSGFVSKKVIDQLAKRNIVYNEPEQEIMLRQYWLSGGDGFVWVEPDQDPAELIWESHLKNLKVSQLQSSSSPVTRKGTSSSNNDDLEDVEKLLN